jgi:hypothetical protein
MTRIGDQGASGVNAWISRQPWRWLVAVVAAWIALAVFNYVVLKLGLESETPLLFPISGLGHPTFHVTGLPWLAAFAVVAALAVRNAEKLPGPAVFAAALALIVLGNLGQGGVDVGFLRPFYESGFQYYHDALKVTSWREWLAGFNQNQTTLFRHSQTHPPFAVLLHYLVLQGTGGSVAALSAVFVLVSAASVVVVRATAATLGASREQRNLLALLFALLPAVNIYTAASLDGVILATSSLFLLGLARLHVRERFDPVGAGLVFAGLLLTNLLTYGGVFLIAVGIAAGGYDLVRRRHAHTLAAVLVSLLLAAAAFLGIARAGGYDHAAGFLTASRIENPHGFRGFAEPAEYVMTRLEDVCEIALFFSFGCLAALLAARERGLRAFDLRDPGGRLALIGVGVLALLFLTGAYRTGETARGCLFIYPYLILTLARRDGQTLRDLCVLAAAQTAAMQLTGSFFW